GWGGDGAGGGGGGEAVCRGGRGASEPREHPAGLRLQSAVRVRRRLVPHLRAPARARRLAAARVPRRPVWGSMSALELRDVVVDYDRRGGGTARAVAGAILTIARGQVVG